jgi:hypothetical protein
MMMTRDLQFNMYCNDGRVGEGVILPTYTNCSGFVIDQIRGHVETVAMFIAAKP